MLQLVEQDQHYYEIIGRNPIKPYFDIDVKVGGQSLNCFSIVVVVRNYRSVNVRLAFMLSPILP